jgi:hypothetical protein
MRRSWVKWLLKMAVIKNSVKCLMIKALKAITGTKKNEMGITEKNLLN